MGGRGVLLMVGLLGVAHAGDATAPDPAEGPGFVSVQRFDAKSRVGIDYTYADHVNARPISHLELHAHYVEPRWRIGGYLQLPYTMQRYDDGSSGIHTRDLFGHVAFGGLWIPHLPSQYVAVVVNVGAALPVDEVEREDASYLPDDLATRAALVRPHDIHATFAGAKAVRLGASLLVRRDAFFSRIDAGYDVSFAGDMYPMRTSSVVLDAAVGLASRIGLSFALELSTITRVSDAPYQIFRSESFDDTNLIGSFALSLRYRRGPIEAYGAALTPLRNPQTSFVRSGLTLGVEYAF